MRNKITNIQICMIPVLLIASLVNIALDGYFDAKEVSLAALEKPVIFNSDLAWLGK